MEARYIVELTDEEREGLRELVSGGKTRVRKLKRAQILLAAEQGEMDAVISSTVAVGTSTVYRTKRRFVEHGLEAALSEESRPGRERKLRGDEEALLVAMVCSTPPEGRARWTLELLAGEFVRRTEHETISRETVRRRLAEASWRVRWLAPSRAGPRGSPVRRGVLGPADGGPAGTGSCRRPRAGSSPRTGTVGPRAAAAGS